MAALSHDIPDLDRKGLRHFGFTTGAIVAVLFGLLFPWLLERALPLWPWILGGVLSVWALLAPSSLRPVYRVWMRFGLLMSRITTPLILGIVFFIVITPIAIIRSLLGKDSLARHLDEASPSYRVESRKAARTNLEKPF
jgi:Kef-type K+ transport system membrane component KefB